MPLRWILATEADRADLAEFCCAFPQRLSTGQDGTPGHPRPYQVNVEVEIQELTFPLPDGDDRVILLGWDDEGLAVVAIYQRARSSEHPPWHFVNLLARANRCHGRGYADEAVQELLRRFIAASASDYIENVVYTKIDTANRASRAMLRRNGFELLNPGALEMWAKKLN